MTSAELTTEHARGFCNVLARQKGLDPAGHAGDFQDLLLLEAPLPWKASMYDKAGVLPQQLLDLQDQWYRDYQAGLGYPHNALIIAPDPVYSREGFRRVMFYTRPESAALASFSPRPEGEGESGSAALCRPSSERSEDREEGVRAFAAFEKVEYLVPKAEAGALVWALYQQPSELPRFEQWRDTTVAHTRDLLVCTHGTVDAACAKFGFPLYRLLRKDYGDEHLRVWRVSHFGGHVFAPTMMDLPTGHSWAYIEPPQAVQVARMDGDVSALRGHYRGWAGIEAGFLQAAERELWQHYGWSWLDFSRAGVIVAKDEANEEAQWADIAIEYASSDDSISGVYRARVQIGPRVETPYTTSEAETYAYEQFVIAHFTLTENTPVG